MTETRAMKIGQKELRELQQKAIAVEVSTATDAGSAERRLGLVGLYKKLGLEAPARSELTRMWQQLPQDQLVLAAMLDMHVERKTIQLLTPLAGAAQRIAKPCVALRLAMAGAHTVLRQIDMAAAQYAELLNADKITLEVMLQLAEFVSSHPSSPALTAASKAFAGRKVNDSLPALLLYVLCRVSETENDPDVSLYLDRIRPRQISQSQILFDLARLSFRFGKWGKAVAAAKKALRISPEHESAKSLLVSAYSFAGHLYKAARCMLTLSKSRPPLSLGSQQFTAILDFAAKQQKLQLVSGVIAAKSKEEGNYQVCVPNSDESSRAAIQYIEKRGGPVGVSVIETTRTAVRAWDVLLKSDWRFPHVIVQQLGNCQILHAFVPSDGPDCWSWQEVSISIDGRRQLAEASKVYFIPGAANQRDEVGTTCSELFKQVEKELMSSPIQKELQ